ncbi:MAG: inositol monophosphatase [Candidatus Omnitrophota bacterium]
MSKEIDKRQALAVKAALEVGKMLLAAFGKKLSIRAKGDRDLVTNIDKKAESLILKAIKKHFPNDGILSEESPHLPSHSGFRWIIDPIDGTHNFIHQIDVFGISLALAFEEKVVAGVIYMPFTRELYQAQKGKGAFSNGKRIRVSRRPLREATMIYDSSIRLDKERMLKSLGELSEQVFNVRMFGSTARSLTYVAAGRAEMEIEFSDKVWDFAAGLLLVEEAGGESTDFAGEPWTLATREYIASNGIVHKQVVNIIKRAEQ